MTTISSQTPLIRKEPEEIAKPHTIETAITSSSTSTSLVVKFGFTGGETLAGLPLISWQIFSRSS